MRTPILGSGAVLIAVLATGAACQTSAPSSSPTPSPTATPLVAPSPSPSATPMPSARPPAPDPATIMDPEHANQRPPENPDNSAADTRDDQPPKATPSPR
ncbi:hypothetical protein [Sphingomonas sp.]|uniref:hypothetical protein n=1 Tax=Sphingomonas sp. TaxID=28214 RepID=UPI002DB67D99|nr:hypothetical protein [Sphingomonas sp.]